MANRNLFASIAGKLLPKTDTINEELAPAYAFSPKHALAQYAATGCLNQTFYATAQTQLEKVLELCCGVESEFVAKTAIYCREKGSMKDMPALLCAYLSFDSPELLKAVFPRVIDNGKMLRNFVQIMRSGAVGRKSLGTLPKRLIRNWLNTRTDEQLFRDSIGQNPSLADVIKMVHPKPGTPSREAMLGYLIGRDVDRGVLPELVRQYEAFKAKEHGNVPDVPFQFLTALDLTPKQWAMIAKNAPWHMTRMNLNTFARHDVFNKPHQVEMIANRLRDENAIARARVFPYQLMAAWMNIGQSVPAEISNALHDAMEIALRNVPQIDGKVYVFPDVSGSMQSSVTGHRSGSTSKVRCVDVAALVAAAVLRKNRSAVVWPFEHRVLNLRLEACDSVMTNARKLAKVGGGGTNCSAPLAKLNKSRAMGDLIVFVSDNESWVDANRPWGSSTETMLQWTTFKKRNPQAKMVCIDIQPYGTTQAKEREDIMNIGGFSDQVFSLITRFAAGNMTADHWVGVIEDVAL